MSPIIAFVAFIFGSRLFALFAFYPIAPAVYLPFDKSLAHLPLLLGCYSFFQSFFQLVWAALSQKIGRFTVIRGGLTLFLAASLLAYWAPTLEVLIVARSLQGACAVGATTQALLADYIIDIKELQVAYYQIGIVIVLSFMLSFLAAPLFQPADLFFLATAVFAVISLTTSFLMPAPPAAKKRDERRDKAFFQRPTAAITATLGVNFGVHFLQALAIGSYQIIVKPGTYEISALFLGALLLCFKPLKERRLPLSFGAAQYTAVVTLGILCLFAASSTISLRIFLSLLCGCTFVLLLLLEASLPAQLRQSAGDHYPLWIGVYTTLQSLAIGLGSLCLYYVEHTAALLSTLALVLLLLSAGAKVLIQRA